MIAAGRARWGRPTASGLAVVALVAAAASLWQTHSARPTLLASDVVKGYLPGAQRFLDTGTPYLPEQLAGAWVLDFHSFIHPPAALPLFLPFLILPLPLWWLVPILVTVTALVWLHPAPWTWPLMALCLLWPRSIGALLTGNSDLWAMAAVAAGAAIGWPIVLLLIKPTFAPLAFVAAAHRSTWIVALIALAAVVATLSLWLEWWAVIQNAGLSWQYSLLNLPLVAVPAVAWLGSPRRARRRLLE